MKKWIALTLASLLVLATVFGCGQKKEAPEAAKEEAVVTRVAALKGPTAMGLVKLMADNDAAEKKKYATEIIAAPDAMPSKILQKEVDIAAVPANLAAVLYNNSKGAVQVLGINTLGVLYLVETGDTIHDMRDLKGRTIYLSGKGATPEYALTHLLKKAGLTPGTDVTLAYKSEHAEVAATLAASSAPSVALLPQPFVTVAQSKNPKMRVAMDLNKAWAGEDGTLITGVVVARKEFVQAHPQAVADFLKDYQSSVTYVQENNDEAAALVGRYDIVPEGVAKKALPACHITLISGQEMQDKLSRYLTILHEQNPKAVGGALPDEDFYYNPKA